MTDIEAKEQFFNFFNITKKKSINTEGHGSSKIARNFGYKDISADDKTNYNKYNNQYW